MHRKHPHRLRADGLPESPLASFCAMAGIVIVTLIILMVAP